MSLLEDRLDRYDVLPETFGHLRKASKDIHDGSANRAKIFYEIIAGKSGPDQPALSDTALRELTSALQAHWQKLFDGKIDDDFVRQSIAIGKRHDEFGITPKLYIAAYNAVTDKLIETIITKFRWRAGDAARVVTALTSVMLLDIELTLTAYCDANAETRHKASENAFADQQLDRTMDLSVAINESAISNARMMNVIGDVDRQAQSISAAVDQMVSGISHIAENGRIAADNAEDAINVTRSGQETVNGAVDSMNAIAHAVADASRRVDVLAEASAKIGEIVQSIEAIASETNLLALNATIEAARAGEAGKGFAVVANEVKALSQQTARATEEIRTRIANLQDETQGIVDAMNSGTEAVSRGQEVMGEVARDIGEIGIKMEDTTRRIADISNILDEQNRATDAVRTGITGIANQTGGQVSAIKSAIATVGEVEQLIEQQVSELVRYDIPNRTIRSARAEHAVYFKAVAETLAGLSNPGQVDIGAADTCRFGKWYNSDASKPFRHLPAFEAVRSPHQAQHKAAHAALDACARKDSAAAEAAFSQMETATIGVLAALKQLADEAAKMMAKPT
ncbi:MULTISPECIES: methyl-accepting chemotaxis protein [Thalassospira]|uniref:Methyl-accepting chemotaxis protein n=1 Tax=Thalassospira aquimaris TaxID=3037796 RepID=A0ABT6GH85_9PROT|nr:MULTISPECIES: methyl-accepting chemotaxis protein [Thalassospira]MDG4721380.1 methyl-accepting chemotaxis protein [Thalassospira sp. FZY0004]